MLLCAKDSLRNLPITLGSCYCSPLQYNQESIAPSRCLIPVEDCASTARWCDAHPKSTNVACDIKPAPGYSFGALDRQLYGLFGDQEAAATKRSRTTTTTTLQCLAMLRWQCVSQSQACQSRLLLLTKTVQRWSGS